MSASRPVDDWRPVWASFADFLEDDTRASGDDVFIIEIDRSRGTRTEWTRAAWRREVARTANAIHSRGIPPGGAIAALAGNAAGGLAVAFACWAHGWTYVPLNAQDTSARHRFVLEHAKATLLVHGQKHLDVALAAAGEKVPTALFSDFSPSDSPKASKRTGWDLPALRVYTSGTTGKPKGVELTSANLITDCDALTRTTGWDASTRTLVVLPIHHVNGLVVSCLQAWYAGSSIVLSDRFRSDTFWADAAAENATTASLVPTLLEFLLEQADTHGRPLESPMREVLCGAGPLMTETVLAFENRFGIPVRHLYGLSETTAVATMMPSGMTGVMRQAWYSEHRFPSVGPALDHVEVEVHDREGRACPANVRGELVIRGATVMNGYADQPDANLLALRDGWFHSGDEGFWRPSHDGTPYFFVTGRIKELIIRGGVNISPLEVDEVINAHPAVRFGLAVAFENRYYGEEVAAYVVPSTEITGEELLDFWAARLDQSYRPKVVLFGEDVPYTATGKARRLALQHLLADRLAAYRNVQFPRRVIPGSAE